MFLRHLKLGGSPTGCNQVPQCFSSCVSRAPRVLQKSFRSHQESEREPSARALGPSPLLSIPVASPFVSDLLGFHLICHFKKDSAAFSLKTIHPDHLLCRPCREPLSTPITSRIFTFYQYFMSHVCFVKDPLGISNRHVALRTREVKKSMWPQRKCLALFRKIPEHDLDSFESNTGS